MNFAAVRRGKNSGTVAAQPYWYDAGYLSANGVLDNGAQSSGYLNFQSTSLAPGASYQINANFTVASSTAPGNYTGEPRECTIGVTAADGLGHGAQGSYVQQVSADAHAIAISTPAAGTPNPAQPGDVVRLSVAAADNLGHPLRYA